MMNDLRICIVGPKPSNAGGISRWCEIYTSYLKRNNFYYFVLDTTPTISIQNRKSFFKRIISSFSPTIHVLSQLKKLIKKKKIDVVHLTTSASLSLIRDKKIINLCNKYSIPVVYHFHFGTFNEVIKKHNWVSKTLVKNSLKCSKVICIDQTSFDCAKNIIPNVVLIHNPIVINNNQSNYLSNRIIFAGHVTKNKGIGELIEAWDVLYKDYKNWELVICGAIFPEFVSCAQDSLNNKKRVIFAGHLSFELLQKEMSQSSVFVLPSYFEGCPNVVLEAMSHSMPIVATDVGAIPELIKDCGILIHPRDANEIANALRIYMDDPSKRKLDGDKAFENVLSNFSDNVVCSKYIKVLKSTQTQEPK